MWLCYEIGESMVKMLLSIGRARNEDCRKKILTSTIESEAPSVSLITLYVISL